MFVPGSPVHVGYSGYNGGHLNGSYRNGGGNSSLTSSPYKSFSASPLSVKYTAASPGGAPARGHGFDPRTFTRSSAARAGAYSIPPEEEEGKTRKTSYHRLNFGAKTEDGNDLNTTYERGKEAGGNSTFTTSACWPWMRKDKVTSRTMNGNIFKRLRENRHADCGEGRQAGGAKVDQCSATI